MASLNEGLWPKCSEGNQMFREHALRALKFFQLCPDMTLEGLGEMFEGYSAETCAGKIPLVPMGGRAEGPACADTGARTPIGTSGIFTCRQVPLSDFVL